MEAAGALATAGLVAGAIEGREGGLPVCGRLLLEWGFGCSAGVIRSGRIDHDRIAGEIRGVRGRGRALQRGADIVMHQIPIIELSHDNQPRHRDQVEAGVQVVFVSELVAVIVAERVPVAREAELVQPMREQLVRLVDGPDEADLPPPDLGRGFHDFTGPCNRRRRWENH